MADVTFETLARSINFRDLGGIAVGDGRAVKRGVLFRSAALSDLSSDELGVLAALSLQSIVDLRHNGERAAHPTPWEGLGCGQYHVVDYQPSSGPGLSELLSDEKLTSDTAHQLMMQVYQDLPFQNVDTLRRLFLTLADGDGPVLFHCTSGKDRTGVAAALILSVLGAKREAIMQDYLASLRFDVLASPAFQGLPPGRMEALRPIFQVNPAYLGAMFTEIEERTGSVEAFLRDSLQLQPSELTALGARLLT